MSIVASNLCVGGIVLQHHGHRSARMDNFRTLQSRWCLHTHCLFFLPQQLSISPREGEARKSIISRAQEREEEYESNDEVFSEMKEWKRDKPPGFGENRTYATSLEDKLLAEIEQSQKALLNQKNRKVSELVPSGVKSVPSGVNVLVGNLPKKKNISRDLQASFKGYPGLLHISPVESGNKKTRDPICKGSAFFMFKNEDVANRFISRYNGESIVFGKIQKQITCSLSSTDAHTESGSKALSTTTMCTIPKLRVRAKGIDFTDHVIESGVFQHQPKENHAKFSVDLGSEYDHRQDNVNGNKELSGRTGADNSVKLSLSSIIENDLDPSDIQFSQRCVTSSPTTSSNDHEHILVDPSEFYEHSRLAKSSNANHKNDTRKDCLMYNDIDEGVLRSEYASKLSQNSMNTNAKRASKKVIESMPNNSKLENVDVSQSNEGKQEYQHQGSNSVQDLEGQTSVSRDENILTMKQNVSSTVLACKTKKQRRKQKAQMKQKQQTGIETKPSKSMPIIGSARRLKKKERSVLSDVLMKYGQHTASST